ncbi:mitotic spindle assembly checkpoint protein MAD2A-like isoform X2 [Mirounga angustirostris]|uniref:mitotic spindle assembly checkpoint protein MAD2A-like isoform X2 n=1 Tax=Mirounga angustirostris TaxID=9716 RepID=UPI00313AA764
MALQLSREQGITLRGSAETVAEFFYWLYKCSVQKLVVVISNIESGEVLERWQFDIECDKTAKDDSAPREKSQKAIQDEIRSVIRQITATVTFLPLLEVSFTPSFIRYILNTYYMPDAVLGTGIQLSQNQGTGMKTTCSDWACRGLKQSPRWD